MLIPRKMDNNMSTIGTLLRVLFAILIFLTSIDGYSKTKYSPPANGCSLNTSSSEGQGIDVYWINLDRSVDRRHFMLDHLKFYNLKSQHRGNSTHCSLFLLTSLSTSPSSPLDSEGAVAQPDLCATRTGIAKRLPITYERSYLAHGLRAVAEEPQQ